MFTYIYTCSCNREHLIKSCLCCFLDMHLYSNNLSAIIIISLLITSELFPACNSCINNFILSQSSFGSDDKNIVFEKDFFSRDDETPEAMIAGELSNLLIDLSLSIFRPFFLRSMLISSANYFPIL